jgi:hypothetical protein
MLALRWRRYVSAVIGIATICWSASGGSQELNHMPPGDILPSTDRLSWAAALVVCTVSISTFVLFMVARNRSGRGAASGSDGATAIPGNVSAKDVAKRTGEAFGREARSPRFQLSIRLGLIGAAVALAYTCFDIVVDGIGMMDWFRETAPVATAVSSVVPGVRFLAAELTRRGFPDRALIVGNAIAAQWLVGGLFFIVAAAIVVPERARLRRGFAAARRTRKESSQSSWRFRLAAWRVRLAALFVSVLFLWWPFVGRSFQTGRYSFDLATGDFGLFMPFLFATLVWWWVAFYVWLRVLAAITGEEPSGSGR